MTSNSRCLGLRQTIHGCEASLKKTTDQLETCQVAAEMEETFEDQHRINSTDGNHLVFNYQTVQWRYE